MVTMDQFINGVMSYYETEIAQKASGVGKFTAYFVLPAIPKMVRDRYDRLKGSPLLDGLVNDDGLIDLDAARERAMQALKHCGSLDVMGFRLNCDDVDILADRIRRA